MVHIITTTLGRIFYGDTGLEIVSSKLWHSWLIYLGKILLYVWPRYDSESDLRIPTDRQTSYIHGKCACINLCSNVFQARLPDQRSSGFLFETWPVTNLFALRFPL